MTFTTSLLRACLPAFALAASLAHAAPLGLDNTFGTNGQVFAKVGHGAANDDARAMVTMSDGRSVVAGSCLVGGTYDFCLTRYTIDGAVDATFGVNGVAVAAIGTGDDIARAVTLDGTKIVVAGSCTQGPLVDFCVARFNANGTLDTTFNATGKVITALSTLPDQAYAVAMDGTKIVVAGECEANGATDLCVVRYNNDGTLDTSLALTGKLVTSIGVFDSFHALAIDAGKIVVAGSCTIYAACVARFNSNGTPDLTFNGTGVSGSSAFPVFSINAIRIGALGRITIAGTCFENVTNTHDFCLYRFESNGAPELGLNGTGSRRFPIGTGDDDATAVAFLGNRTVVSGHCAVGAVKRFCAAMLTDQGTFDPNFNLGAPLIDSFGISSDAIASSMTVFSDLLITIAGTCGLSYAQDFCIVRLAASGQRDPGFNGGVARIDDLGQGDAFESVRMFVRQPDGKIIAVSDCQYTRFVDSVIFYDSANCLARFLPGGALDTTFGVAGRVMLKHATGQRYYGTATLDSQGRILVAGACGDLPVSFCVTRLTPSGVPDVNFAGTGTAQVAMGGAVSVRNVSGIVAVANDAMVVGGSCDGTSGAESFCLVKLIFNSALDLSFGTGGRVQPTDFVQMAAMAYDGSGFILVGTCFGGGSRFCATRYQANGAPDPAWNFGGRVLAQFPGKDSTAAAVLAVGGKVVIAGECRVPGQSSEPCAARLNGADGTLDTSFSGDGLQLVASGPLDDRFTALAADGTGLLASGQCTDASGRIDICITRFLADGTVDVAFNDTGSYRSSLGTGSALVGAMLRESNRILVGSYCQEPVLGDYDLCLTAYVLLPNDVPRAPTGVVVTAGDGQVTVAFVPPTDNGGNAINGYTATCDARSAIGAGSPIVIDQLANGVTVSCVVRAMNSAGTGPPSDPPVDATPRKVATVTLDSTPNPSSPNQMVSFTASVSGTAPSGVVEFRSAGVLLPGCGPDTLVSGVARCTTNQLPAGTTIVTASYLGDAANTPGTSSPYSQVVIASAVTLGVSRAGLGLGTITSNPGSIDCGIACVELFPPGSVVTLVFTPVSGATVTWLQGCTIFTVNTCVVILDSSRNVLAIVNPDPDDLDGDGIPNAVETLEGRNPNARDNDVFGNPRLFVMQQYRDFLGREGDAPGIQGWVDLINAGTYSRLQVIDAFLSSQEFSGFVAPVVRLYFATFLRVPDYAGLTFNAGLVRNGTVTLANLADFFVASPEFQSTYGALNDTQFVTLLYNNVLGRAPDAAGLAGWVGLLQSGYTRGQVLLGFSESTEYQAATANEVFVTIMYAGMLRRTPEPTGFAGWLAFLDTAALTRAQVINGFFLSTEYHGRFLP